MTKLLLLLALVISNPVSSRSYSNSPSSERGPALDLIGGGGWGVEYLRTVPDCYTFTVDNVSNYALGTVTVSGIGSSAYFNVTGTGSYQQSICFTAISVTVAGTVVSYPNTAIVDLGSGTLVKVLWQSSSVVEIENKDEVGSPQP